MIKHINTYTVTQMNIHISWDVEKPYIALGPPVQSHHKSSSQFGLLPNEFHNKLVVFRVFWISDCIVGIVWLWTIKEL